MANGAEILYGSSPLVRGQLLSATLRRMPGRIIPARAGPTRLYILLISRAPDHPRSCGANPPESLGALTLPGSSPLVRGQQFQPVQVNLIGRIIPARAGPTRVL